MTKARQNADSLREPGTSTNPGLAFDTWRTPNANRPTLVTIDLTLHTDGSTTAVINFDVDESGGTTADYLFRGEANSGAGSHFERSFITALIPAGGSYRIFNEADPLGSNAINDHREFTL